KGGSRGLIAEKSLRRDSEANPKLLSRRAGPMLGLKGVLFHETYESGGHRVDCGAGGCAGTGADRPGGHGSQGVHRGGVLPVPVVGRNPEGEDGGDGGGEGGERYQEGAGTGCVGERPSGDGAPATGGRGAH